MDNDGRDEEGTPDNTTTDDEDDHTDKETSRCKCLAAAHAASVDDTADGEPHDPDIEPEDDTTEPNHQGLNEHEESSRDADSNPSFDEVPNDNPEDELAPGVDKMVRATRKADELLASGITSRILRPTGNRHGMNAKRREGR